MKNPTEPNLKTEWFSVFILILSTLAALYFRSKFPDSLTISWDANGEPAKTISWTLLTYLWPIMLSVVYSMFLFFPYFKINHIEGSVLKEQWHKAKELVMSFLFTLQITGGLILSGGDKSLMWALPILFFLLITSLIPTIIKVIKYRKQILIKL